MKHENKKGLIETLSVQTATYKTKNMELFIHEQLKSIEGCETYEDNGNIYITRGKAETYPCIVAHTDTVHDIYKNFNIFELQGKLISVDGSNMNRVGIGGDDKVGVFIALEVLRKVDVCKVAFFRDEEIGCVGSREADMSFFDNVEFVLQCDRQKRSDFVTNIFATKLCSDDFSEAIKPVLEKYKRKETDGGLTDVYQLVENGLGVSCANMSCGYYDPHSNNEYVIINHVFSTLSFVLKLFGTLSGKVWEVDSADTDDYGNNHYYGYGNSRYGSWGSKKWGSDDYYDEFDEWNRSFGIDPEDKDDDYCCPNCNGTELLDDDFDERLWCCSCGEFTDVLQKLIDDMAIEPGDDTVPF